MSETDKQQPSDSGCSLEGLHAVVKELQAANITAGIDYDLTPAINRLQKNVRDMCPQPDSSKDNSYPRQ